MVNSDKFQELVSLMCERLQKEKKDNHILSAKNILIFIADGIFSMYAMRSDLYRYGKGYLRNPEENLVWKQFDIPYLKRILKRMEKRKLVKIEVHNGKQIVTIEEKGRRKILQYALGEMTIKKPTIWDGYWWLVTYDLPKEKSKLRDVIRRYFTNWGFYPIQESVYLHAYPCREETIFLREYFEIGEYVKVFKVADLENEQILKEFFNL